MLDIMLVPARRARRRQQLHLHHPRAVLVRAPTPIRPYSAAIGSLKGPRHGGANRQVHGDASDDIEQNVANWEDDDEVRGVPGPHREQAGLMTNPAWCYGMGHAVYTLSDPRAVILKRFAAKLAAGTEDER